MGTGETMMTMIKSLDRSAPKLAFVCERAGGESGGKKGQRGRRDESCEVFVSFGFLSSYVCGVLRLPVVLVGAGRMRWNVFKSLL